MGKHFGQTIIREVLKLRKEGRTNREIGEHLGLSKTQIRKLLERYRKNERKKELGILIHPIGRPKKLTQGEEEKLRFQNKQLKMENELLRDFLLATGRR
jgi:response regulator of citrate/malate metabolism